MSQHDRQPDDGLDAAFAPDFDLDGAAFMAKCSPEERMQLADLQFLDALLTHACSESPDSVEQRVRRAVLAVADPPAVPPRVSLPIGFLGNAYHGTVGFFSQEIPFACLVTTIIMGIAGVIGLNVTKEHYTQLPWKSMASADRSYAAPESDAADKANAAVKKQKEEVAQWVGQITGKVDCVWADDSTAPIWHKIELHDKFNLKSGLVEITYYSGAKVILQGPCAYEVDSAAGGYLSLGKLTARVKKKGAGEEAVASGQWLVASEKGVRGEGRGEKVASGQWPVASENAESRNPKIPKSQNHSSLTTNHQPLPTNLFAVRTPTAVVTDLGTEFGVEVCESGDTTTQVFVGAVQVVCGAWDDSGKGEVLEAGQSARVKRDRPDVVLMQNISMERKQFVRDLRVHSASKVISINFTHGDRSNIDVSEAMGAFAARHWNNVDGSPQPAPLVELHNAAGKPTGAQLTWQWSDLVAFPTWFNDDSCFHKLLDGHFAGVDQGTAWPSLKIMVRHLPFAGYRLVVYYWLEPSTDPELFHTFGLAVNGGKPLIVGRASSALFGFHRYRNTKESGNYQIFEQLSGDLTLDASPIGESDFHQLFIAGMQIIETADRREKENVKTEN